MNYKKLNQEMISFTMLMMVSIIIVIVSAVYIKVGYDKDNIIYMIGGAFFLCFALYGLFVFVKRIQKVELARKSGDMIL